MCAKLRMSEQIEVIDSFLSGHVPDSTPKAEAKKRLTVLLSTLLQVQGLCRQQVPASPRTV